MTVVLNCFLHLVAMIFTEIAAIMNLAADDTPDFPTSWCCVMLVGSFLAFFLTILYYGCGVCGTQGLAWAFPGTLIYGTFLAVFVSTLKLAYYAEMGGTGLAKNSAAVTLVALYLQCFVVASMV